MMKTRQQKIRYGMALMVLGVGFLYLSKSIVGADVVSAVANDGGKLAIILGLSIFCIIIGILMLVLSLRSK